MSAVRHIPQRTCIACGKIQSKREMVRLVRVAENNIEVDTAGRKAGRGAYLCRSEDCCGLGLNGNRVERALKMNLAKTDREKLKQDLKELCGGESK